jgi:hypothetical protein
LGRYFGPYDFTLAIADCFLFRDGRRVFRKTIISAREKAGITTSKVTCKHTQIVVYSQN